MIEVLRAGLCDLVMDQGRFGYGALGVPVGGAADPAALAAANRLVGNAAGLAGLEITLAGPVLRFPAGGMVALTGARFAATRSSGAKVAWNQTLVLAAGETLTLERVEAGCRCWLAVGGGLAVPLVMDSRSTFLPAGFGCKRGMPCLAAKRTRK
jgi:allophanate hydrolase subunit 2